jgi:Domain of unknown function (DUF4905)
MFVGEERLIEEKKAAFFCLDNQNGRELWRQTSLIDAWWVGIEAVHGDTLFLHGFATPELPQHRGIVAVDVRTGKKLWEEKQLQFIAVFHDAVVGARETSTGRVFVELERRTGVTRGGLTPGELQTRGSEGAPGNEMKEPIQLPVQLEELADDDPQIEAAVGSQVDTERVVGPIEVVEHGNYLIFDYLERPAGATPAEPSYAHVIKVVERTTGSIVYSDLMSAGAHHVVPEMFFVQHDMLYYIKERRALMAVRLVS